MKRKTGDQEGRDRDTTGSPGTKRGESATGVPRRRFLGMVLKGVIGGGAAFLISSKAHAVTACTYTGGGNWCAPDVNGKTNSCGDNENNDCGRNASYNWCTGNTSSANICEGGDSSIYNSCLGDTPNNCAGKPTDGDQHNTCRGDDAVVENSCTDGSNNTCQFKSNRCFGSGSAVTNNCGTPGDKGGWNTCNSMRDPTGASEGGSNVCDGPTVRNSCEGGDPTSGASFNKCIGGGPGPPPGAEAADYCTGEATNTCEVSGGPGGTRYNLCEYNYSNVCYGKGTINGCPAGGGVNQCWGEGQITNRCYGGATNHVWNMGCP